MDKIIYNLPEKFRRSQEEGCKFALIGAGLPRTTSLRPALPMLLGGHGCYHMYDAAQGPKEDLRFWNRMAKLSVTRTQKLFQRRKGLRGRRGHVFYKDLMKEGLSRG